MDRLALLFPAIALTLGSLPLDGATAQEPGWTAPGGRFAISFPEGWGVIEPPQAAHPQVLVHFGQTTDFVELKQCFIYNQPAGPLSGRAQPDLNALVAQWGEAEILGNLGRADMAPSVIGWDNVAVDGVQVASAVIRIGLEPGPHLHTRQFILDEDGAARYYGVHCSIYQPQTRRSDDVEALLASLRFIQ
jgi:hypothetical protein